MIKKNEDAIGEAEEYDLFGYPDTTMQDCDFLEDAIHILECPNPALLDIACGTGRHALEMARRGYTVTAVDKSADMLRVAVENSTAEGLDVHFDQCDMREMEYYQEFDIAYVLFNTMGLLTSNDDVSNFLDKTYAALRHNGLFIFQVGNLWSYIAEGHFLNSAYESEQENNGVKRRLVMHQVIGPYNNVYRMQYEKYFWRDGKKLPSRSEEIDLRIFSINELDLLLENSGFKRLKVFGATDFNAVIDNPARIQLIQKPYHSYVVLALKVEYEVAADGKSAPHSDWWGLRRDMRNTSYQRPLTHKGIPLGISQRCDAMAYRQMSRNRHRPKKRPVIYY